MAPGFNQVPTLYNMEHTPREPSNELHMFVLKEAPIHNCIIKDTSQMALGKIILGMDSQSVPHRHSIMENNVDYIIIHMASQH